MNKKVLGLDLGTNSIGWALVDCFEADKIDKKQLEPFKIVGMGSRIVPMDAGTLSDFDNGKLKSQTSVRTVFRGARRLRERSLLRRERLHRTLNVLGFLPPHYAQEIDFTKRLGQFLPETEPKIAYQFDEETQKFEFIFKESFSEMMQDFAQHQPEMVQDGKKVPYNWTIYYLRKKALTAKISKQELAWLLLHFNQKRGYYQLRGEEEEMDVVKEYMKIKVVDVVDSGDKKAGATWYDIHLENGDIYKRSSKILVDWIGKFKEFIVTTKLDKDGNEKRSYSIPAEGDWTLVKKKTENDLDKSGKEVGEYIYGNLLASPKLKLKGELIRTIERKYYRTELTKILNKQIEFHSELQDRKLYESCIAELYKSNEGYRESIRNKSFSYLFIDNILFYQRPLKSKKSLIENCQYEYRSYKNPKSGEIEKEELKAISRSQPLFQEFRLWQFIKNVKIVKDGNDVTSTFLNDDDSYAELFDKLKTKKELTQKSFLACFKIKETEYTWNYGDKILPMCSTYYDIAFRLSKIGGIAKNFLTDEIVEHLWHILYSVNDKKELNTALHSFAQKQGIDNIESFVLEFGKIKPYDKAYASYSSKAIKKLLALMRMGKYWNEAAIDPKTKARIDKFIDGEECESIGDFVREKVEKELGSELKASLFKGLPLWVACYVVYNRHSEASDASQWKSPEDIDKFLKEFRQHSLRNPLVEQIICETLRVVRDVWTAHGNPSEIHIELSRQMKNPKDERIRLTQQNQTNENTNLRIKALLTELKNDGNDVRPESPAQQERLKIYEESMLGLDWEIPEDILKITRQRQPSQSEITRYKCWLEQGYCSPYTGNTIPLSKLFSDEYQIEHVLAQARYYDDSLSNKIICESAVNQEKGKMLAWEYINEKGGTKIALNGGGVATILSLDEYESFVKRNFKNSALKRRKLLMDKIPTEFIERQMNDTRYISRYIKSLLSNIVREEGEQEATAKKLISVTGAATSKLKEDWGLNKVWNKIVTPRFVRLNEISKSNNFGAWEDKQNFKAQVPLELQRGFSKKRIDHRHHALDALVIACATRLHVNYFSNEHAKSGDEATRNKIKNSLYTSSKKHIDKPWDTFTQDALLALNNIVISYKKNLRIITKSTNRYMRYEEGVKKMVKQAKGDHLSIRKPLHKETVYGRVNLQLRKTVKLSAALDNWQMIVDKDLRDKIKQLVEEGFNVKQLTAHFKDSDNRFAQKDISRVEVYYFSDENQPLVASRKPLDTSFDIKKIESITDTGIRSILTNHLSFHNWSTEEAFSPDGIEEMNKNIRFLNNGKFHQPIYKVRVFETLGFKYNVGETGNKKSKYVEAAQGTNLFFAIYEDENGKRKFETIPLYIVIENLKRGEKAVPPNNKKGDKLLFTLSPNDLVYLPTPDQLDRKIDINDIEGNKDRIYKFVSCTRNEGYFIPSNIAYAIVPTTELGTNNKAQQAWTGEMIKEICIKLVIDKIGRIKIPVVH